MHKKLLLLLSLVGACATFGGAGAAPAPARPNILFIFADDWGWGDLGIHGRPGLQTPNLDRLAREGTDFAQFLVPNPVCSPSRTAIVTGHYPARYRIHEHFASPKDNAARGMPDWLDPREALLPLLFKQAGYTTGHFGKWHLGGDGPAKGVPLPAKYGFDQAAVWAGPGPTVFEGTAFADKDGAPQDPVTAAYLSAAAVEHALRFLRATNGRPFFLNLWLHETHHRVSATAEDRKAYPDLPEPQQTFYSAVTRADRLVGRVLDMLKELGVDDNTLVVFTADNGPEDTQPNPTDKFYYSVGSTGGLRGRKRSLYLGGVNTPFIVRWPGRVPAGRVDKTSVISGVDMLPTLLAAAGISLPADYVPDGVNALPAFLGEPLQRAKPLFWEWRGTHVRPANWPQLAMRDGDMILLMTEDESRVELYDVIRDRAQEHNLAADHPAKVGAMVAAIREWKATLPPTPPQTGPRSAASAKNDAAAPTDRNQLFNNWDADADGFLSRQEYAAGLANKANAEARFQRMDRDGDGKISRPEFVEFANR